MVNGDPKDVMDFDARMRSLLFVPGDQPERVKKALSSNADGVVIDLEDAVSPEHRQQARTLLKNAHDESSVGNSTLIIVRVNPYGTVDFLEDLKSVLAAGVGFILVSKFIAGDLAKEMDAEISVLEAEAGRVSPLYAIALIESAAGVLSLLNSSHLPTRVRRLAFGAADFHADLATSHLRPDIHSDLAHSAIVLASAAASLDAPLDSPYFSLDDDVGLRESARMARERGFGGKLAIHPKQINAIHESFRMSEDELGWARKVIAEWESPARAGRAAIKVDGQLADMAMVRRARQIIANQ